MNHAERLARHLCQQGPGAIYTSHEIAAVLDTTRTIASTYLRRAEARGWVRPLDVVQHGGTGRRTAGSVTVRFEALEAVRTETVMVCPRCQVYPPRYYQARLQGHTPLCQRCDDDRTRAKYRRRAVRRAGSDDLSPVEIDRRYQHALAQIRRQRWDARS
jgi:hypothetical protein